MNLRELIPASVIQHGPEAVLRFIRHATPVGAFLRSPEMRQLVAEDLLLDEAQAVVDTPNFLDGEDRLLMDWKKQRPEIAAQADKLAADTLAAYAPFEGHAATRLLLRKAAIRRLDAIQCGRQNFVPCPELGGMPYVEIPLEGHGDPLLMGRVDMATYEPDARRDREIWEFITVPGRIEAVERGLEPLMPPEEDPAEWQMLCTLRAELAEAVRWERSFSIPSLMRTVILDFENPPTGVKVRPRVAELVKETGSQAVLPLLAWLGVSPFVLEAYEPFLERQRDRIEMLAEDPDLPGDFLSDCPAARTLADSLTRDPQAA